MMKLVSFTNTSAETKREDLTTSEKVAMAALGCSHEHGRLIIASGGEPHSVMDYVQVGEKGIVVVVIGPDTETNLRGFIREIADHPQLFDESERVETRNGN